jgi:hypothetical protein
MLLQCSLAIFQNIPVSLMDNDFDMPTRHDLSDGCGRAVFGVTGLENHYPLSLSLLLKYTTQPDRMNVLPETRIVRNKNYQNNFRRFAVVDLQSIWHRLLLADRGSTKAVALLCLLGHMTSTCKRTSLTDEDN